MSVKKESVKEKIRRVSILISICIRIAREIQSKTSQFATIGYALEFYALKYILIGDVHLLNLAQVRREGKDIWVIIDPGNSIFFTNKYDYLFRDLYE